MAEQKFQGAVVTSVKKRDTMAEQKFQRAVVTSVSLSCLLTMDYVPKAKPPSVDYMVKQELARVLSVVNKTQRYPPELAFELDRGFAPNPVDLLRRVTHRILDLEEASREIIDHGHEDMVFSALQYTRKPPTATDARIKRITKEVAAVLKVEIPDDFDTLIGDVYDATHSMLIRT
jgi:hypothetical protein